jgi:hypothetical protein
MSPTAIAVRNWIMRIHRWMGVAFCLLFLTWFVSGIVMIYCRFPHVEAEDRLSRAASLDPGAYSCPANVGIRDASRISRTDADPAVRARWAASLPV